MDAGELPNMAKLAGMGTAGPLVSTNPAESAAGWAAINTGANPVKNGVPSFFKRDFAGDTPVPGLGHVRQESVMSGDFGSGSASGGADDVVKALGSGKNNILLGVGVFFLATIILRLVLKAHALLALILGLGLGAAAAYGTKGAESRLSEGAAASVSIPGIVKNQVRLDGFWVEAARAGQRSVALQAPLALDRPGADGARTLYGLGNPDTRGSLNGDWYIYSTDTLTSEREPKGDTRSSNTGTGTIFRVDFTKPKDGEDPAGPRAISASIYGPVDYGKMAEVQAQYDELTVRGEDPQLSFKESRVISIEKDPLERTLAEMGAPPKGSRIKPKEYKHRATVPLRVVAVEGAEVPSWEVTIGEESQTITADGWSEFYSVHFDMGSLPSVNAVTRARVMTEDPFELYIDTLQIDPRNPAPWQPISEPAGFSGELAKMVGSPFETLGWGCMTNQVKDKMIDPEIFLQDVEFTMTYRRRLMQRMLAESDWRILYSVFSVTDRVQHMMYRYYDPLHPQYKEKEAARKVTFFGEEITLAEAIPAVYRQMDDIVGEVMEALQPEDTLMLCADHGFTSYRRGLNVNNWLESEGYIVLKPDLTKTSQGSGFQCVDWEKTRAYSLGLGMVFLNLKGREAEGIVDPADAQPLMEEICERFLALREDGAVVGSSATIVRDIYEGPEAWGTAEFPCADVMLGLGEFYRVSWSSTTGKLPLRSEGEGDAKKIVPAGLYKDNTNPWSGDHASNDPRLVTGIFFCNQKVSSEDGEFSVMDIAPTVLERVGAPLPAHLDRKPLTFQ
jgi:predicted AlkP superfamily phosphohydrolase/phosphomutase